MYQIKLLEELWKIFNVAYDYILNLLEKEWAARLIVLLIILRGLSKYVAVICRKIKRKSEKLKIKENVENIKESVQSMHKSGHLDTTYFYKLPDNLIDKKIIFKIIFSVGISLLLPDEVLRKLLGRSLVLEPIKKNIDHGKDLEIQLEKIEILANKDTKVHVKITNNTTQDIRFKKHFQNSEVNKFIRENVSFKINGEYSIGYEDTDSKDFYKNAQLNANSSEIIQFVFNKLSDKLIRRIEKVDFEYRIPKLRKTQEYLDELQFSETIDFFEIDKIEEHYDYISEDAYELFLQIGGFLIIPILILSFIALFKLGSINLVLFILNIFVFIFCLNLNHRLQDLIDSKRVRKNANMVRK